MLLIGIDKDEGRTHDPTYGTDNSGYRSDSIMLCRIDPGEKKVTMVSIHRDTMVDMDEHGTQKINAAYSIGGAAYATEVVSTFADVPISHYGEVDLDRFIQIVDVVGGVTVDLPVPVYDPEYTGLDLPAGVQTLDGRTAALLCRCRHGYDAYGDGDRFRAANQRMVFSEVIKKVLASDPATMMNTVSAIADCVTTDLGIAEILDLASQMMTLNVETDIMTGMEPTDGVLIEDGWYEICLVDQWKKMMTRVDQGLPPYDETEGEHDSTAGIAGGVGEEGARAAEVAGTPEYVEPTLSSDTSSGYDGNGYGDAGGYAYDYSTTYYDGGDYSGDTGYTEEYVDYSEGGEVASEEVSYDESGGGGEEVATEEYTGE
jgi:LCP family protein required for cell wall assembly